MQNSLDPTIELSPTPGDEFKTTTCYMCACRCGIKVWLQDGQIRYIQGNPEHPVNQGVLCAKGSAGIMQHYSPARLNKPLLRVGERGSGEFREISWDEAMSLAVSWLKPLRENNPDQLAFFTGRDQSQALTGWWAQQFGTINYAAHGGFCSVNMAAGGLYTVGGSFWEFGEPDWDRTELLMMWGVAEDHDSNPIKLGLGKLKQRGAKIISVNPVRTGYGAIADEWIGIRPGTDGLFAFALIHELLRTQRVDLDYLVQFCNAHWLVIDAPGTSEDGLFLRDADGKVLCFDRASSSCVDASSLGIQPAIVGEYEYNGLRARPVFAHIVDRYGSDEYAPRNVAERCGVSVDTIERIARELAEAAFDKSFELPVPWTDAWGREHQTMVGRPVSMHAMRGISAHTNGFHTCRALHVLQMLLGAIDAPGSFRYQPPFPKPIAPPNRPGKTRNENGVLDAGPLGFVHGPEDLVVDGEGQPRRIDHAYSWAYPLSAHGMMHTVIRNAVEGNPYKIDTLMMFMANMSWNSTMNTSQTMDMLTAKDDNGEYKIPRIIYSDAFASEMVSYADLILPDTTYLERYDAISLLDRPISDAEAVIDSIRHPVVDAASQAEGRDVRGFQSVLIDLGTRLGLPGLINADGSAKYKDYADYMVNHERMPGVGLLAGWRGEDGTQMGVGAPNPQQLERYIENGSFWRHEIPHEALYYKMANNAYLDWAVGLGLIKHADPIVLQLYSETLQKFRLAAQGHGEHQPPAEHRERVATYFDPLPIWYEPFAHAEQSMEEFPVSAITQRPMFMYHSWGSQNAWLRQITARNYLYLHADLAKQHGIADMDWVVAESHNGAITAQAKIASNVERNTVWTWNAMGKRQRAWSLSDGAPESQKGFLLNHLISDLTPKAKYSNSDPVTGQAAWFDLRINIRRASEQEAAMSEDAVLSQPQFPPVAPREQHKDQGKPLRYGAQFRAERKAMKS